MFIFDKLREQKLKTFKLDKYYFDAVDPLGQTWIGYSARLSWFGFCLNYSQSLFSENNQNMSLKTNFQKHPSPQADPEFICNTKLFSLSAQIHARGFSERLHNNTQGLVDWHCLEPSTNMSVRLANKKEFLGIGYIEKLTMTIKPWQLPIASLIWGRFIGQKHTAVWIKWEHSKTQNWLFINGQKQDQGDISNSFVKTNNWNLNIEHEKTLINSRPFMEHTRLVGMLMPSSMRNMHEQKYLGRGYLQTGKEADQGWVIHERVKFKVV